jgi:hypothetical protein
MVLSDPSDESALQRWLEMQVRHGKRQEALKCYQEMKAFVEEQGFTFSPAIEETIRSLTQRAYLLLPPIETIQPIEQPSREVLAHWHF